jgi:hypothetical protein
MSISSPLRLPEERTQGAGWAIARPDAIFVFGAAVYLVLAALAFIVVRPTTLLYFADYWEHRAVISEVIRDGTALRDPIYGEAASSRQFTPWSLGLGFLARGTGLGVDTVLDVGALLVSVLFVVGLYHFGRTYFRHRWAPALLLAVLTCGWGLPPLMWTGFYALRSQLHSNYYPASLVFALTFIAWGQTVRLLRSRTIGLPGAILLGAIVAISLLTHPLNAAFLIAGAVGFVLIEPEIARTRRIGVIAVLVSGVLVTTLWPYFNPLALAGSGIARGQQTFNNFAFFFDLRFVLTQIWPALLALLAAPSQWRDERSRPLVIGLWLVTAAYAYGGIADVSVSHRVLAYVLLALHLMLVRALLDSIDGRYPGLSQPRPARLALAAGLALVAGQVALAVEQLTNPWAKSHYEYPLHPVDEETRRVVELLPTGARVMGWNSAALVLPAFGVPVVAFPRPMVFSPTDADRQEDYRRFFWVEVPTSERLAIASRWGATHVAYLPHELPHVIEREVETLGPVTSVGPWRIVLLPAQGR